MRDLPALNVVVVAYGSSSLLRQCLGTLGNELSVLVIDNSSNDEVRDLARMHGCRYVDAGRNIGFAAGVNRAIAELGPDHGDVLLLNPDARLDGDAARALQRAMHEHARQACVSPALTRDDGSVEQVEWPFPSPGRAWLEAVGLGAVPPRTAFLVGAVLLLRSEAIDDVGPFDEQFFLYAEETDWQLRATRSGWSLRVCEELVARHTGAGSSSDGRHRQALFHASVERYIRKWHGPAGWQTFRAAVVVGAGVRSLASRNRAPHRDRFLRYLRGPVRCAEALSQPS